MSNVITRMLVGISALLLLATAAIAATKPTDKPADAMATCSEMMQGAGVTEEGKKAMQEFMQSPRAPEAMTNMMAMMGSMGGGMMGGQSGMMPPGGRQPAK